MVSVLTAARAVAERLVSPSKSHFTDVLASWHISQHHFAAANIARDGQRTDAHHVQTVAVITFAKQQLAGLETSAGWSTLANLT